MEQIIDYLLRFGHLTPQQIELIKTKLTTLHLNKGDYFSEAGTIANRVGFITDGVMRVCYYSNKGEEFTRCFVPENRYVVDLNSFHNKTHTAEYIEALTDCELLFFSREAFTELGTIIPAWNDMFVRIGSSSLMTKVQAATAMINQDAKTRYLGFLEQYPGVANRVPLSALASYLGITQSSLSRVRKAVK